MKEPIGVRAPERITVDFIKFTYSNCENFTRKCRPIEKVSKDRMAKKVKHRKEFICFFKDEIP